MINRYGEKRAANADGKQAPSIDSSNTRVVTGTLQAYVRLIDMFFRDNYRIQ